MYTCKCVYVERGNGRKGKGGGGGGSFLAINPPFNCVQYMIKLVYKRSDLLSHPVWPQTFTASDRIVSSPQGEIAPMIAHMWSLQMQTSTSLPTV